LQGAKVLWVDDNPDNNSYERSLLEQLGVRFVLAKSTDEAVSLLRGQKFHLVITDFARVGDGKAGYTLLDEVKKMKLEPSPPLIIYSSSANPKFIAEAKERDAFAETNQPQELFNKAIDAIRQSR
jgi:CheY-like chemotaxis protein